MFFLLVYRTNVCHLFQFNFNLVNSCFCFLFFCTLFALVLSLCRCSCWFCSDTVCCFRPLCWLLWNILYACVCVCVCLSASGDCHCVLTYSYKSQSTLPLSACSCSPWAAFECFILFIYLCFFHSFFVLSVVGFMFCMTAWTHTLQAALLLVLCCCFFIHTHSTNACTFYSVSMCVCASEMSDHIGETKTRDKL